jgi:hypothetical protein
LWTQTEFGSGSFQVTFHIDGTSQPTSIAEITGEDICGTSRPASLSIEKIATCEFEVEYGIFAMDDIAVRVLLQIFDVNAAEHPFGPGTRTLDVAAPGL